MRSVALVVALALTQSPTTVPMTPAPPVPRAIAAGTYLIPGAMLPDRGPDGNTVVFIAPGGLVVVDTGRHAWHSDAILAFATARRQPITAIVNTHWHLDHSSGNRRLKAAHPDARVYTTSAVDRALAPGGFIARSLASARAQAPDPRAPPTRQEETALFLSTMETPQALRPDVAIATSGTQHLSGRALSVRVTDDTVTDADLWIYDQTTRVAVVGDLVTLPAPFFETACPAGWQAALDAVWATPFTLAVPGHGAPMTREAFNTYRRAFAAFRACVGSDRTPASCAADWTRGVGALLATDGERKQATGYAAYYVEFLRTNGGASPDCRASRTFGAGPLVQDHPVDPEAVLHLAEARGEERLGEGHELAAAGRKRGVEAFGLAVARRGEREVGAAHGRRVRDVGTRELRAADAEPRVQHGVLPFRRHAGRRRRLAVRHHEEDAAAQMGLVVAEGLRAAAGEVHVGRQSHAGGLLDGSVGPAGPPARWAARCSSA